MNITDIKNYVDLIKEELKKDSNKAANMLCYLSDWIELGIKYEIAEQPTAEVDRTQAEELELEIQKLRHIKTELGKQVAEMKGKEKSLEADKAIDTKAIRTYRAHVRNKAISEAEAELGIEDLQEKLLNDKMLVSNKGLGICPATRYMVLKHPLFSVCVYNNKEQFKMDTRITPDGMKYIQKKYAHTNKEVVGLFPTKFKLQLEASRPEVAELLKALSAGDKTTTLFDGMRTFIRKVTKDGIIVGTIEEDIPQYPHAYKLCDRYGRIDLLVIHSKSYYCEQWTTNLFGTIKSRSLPVSGEYAHLFENQLAFSAYEKALKPIAWEIQNY